MLGFVALAVFAVLFLRLWALQVLSGDKYRAEANDNRVRTIQIDAPRGDDRRPQRARARHERRSGTSLELWPADLPKSWRGASARARALATVAAIPVDADPRRRSSRTRDDPLDPGRRCAAAIHPDQIDYLEEHQLEFPGVQLAETLPAQLPVQVAAAQVLGYVGPITPGGAARRPRSEGYQPQDVDGPGGDRAELRPLPAGHGRHRRS